MSKEKITKILLPVTIAALACSAEAKAMSMGEAVAKYRTCWTVVRSIAATEQNLPSSDPWDFLLKNRKAFGILDSLGCQRVGFIRPDTHQFSKDRLRPKCVDHLKIEPDTKWHRAFDGIPAKWPVWVGCVWYQKD